MLYMSNTRINPEDTIATLLEAQRRYEPVMREYTHQWEDGRKFDQKDVTHLNKECEQIEKYIRVSSGDWKQPDKDDALQKLSIWRGSTLKRLQSIQINADTGQNSLIVQTAIEEMYTLFDYPYKVIDTLLNAQKEYNNKKYYGHK